MAKKTRDSSSKKLKHMTVHVLTDLLSKWLNLIGSRWKLADWKGSLLSSISCYFQHNHLPAEAEEPLAERNSSAFVISNLWKVGGSRTGSTCTFHQISYITEWSRLFEPLALKLVNDININKVQMPQTCYINISTYILSLCYSGAFETVTQTGCVLAAAQGTNSSWRRRLISQNYPEGAFSLVSENTCLVSKLTD